MKRFGIIALILTLAAASTIWAQEDTAQVTLRITSNPPGVTVNLDGPYQLTTTTPSDITQELMGTYRVKAEKFGYESWNSYITLTPDQPASLRISLSPKTRIKAAFRSVLLPGWGQFYSDRKGWGYFFATGSLVMATGFVLADLHYSNEYDDYLDAKKEFEEAVSIEEKTKLKEKLDDRQSKAYDAQKLRNAALGVSIAFWAYNVLDNIIFFPSVQSGVFEKLSTDFDPNTGQVRLTYNYSF
jgi:hypothetical protein